MLMRRAPVNGSRRRPPIGEADDCSQQDGSETCSARPYFASKRPPIAPAAPSGSQAPSRLQSKIIRQIMQPPIQRLQLFECPPVFIGPIEPRKPCLQIFVL